MLTAENYFDAESQLKYFSVSQFKSFIKCEASTIAELSGNYEREASTSLLLGSYVDAHFEGTLDIFKAKHPQIFKKNGSLKSEYMRANEMINRVERDPLMTDFLNGEKQVIMTAKLFGYSWKIKMDVYQPGKRIVDLKTVKDFKPIYEEGYGWRHPIEYWGWDLQGAIYQKVEQLYTGRAYPLPFYLVIVTKEKIPDIAVIQLPQHILDAAMMANGVEARIDRFALIKSGDVPPIRCEKCDFCKETKVLKGPEIYEIKEAI